MAIQSLRILFRLDFADGRVTRLWDGAGPFVGTDLAIWKGAGLITGSLDAIEQAINGDAATLNLTVGGVSPETGDVLWDYYKSGALVSGTLQILLQACDKADQPVGDVRIVYKGRIDNVTFDEAITEDRPTVSATVSIVNAFTLRRLTNGASLSDVDQRARSAVLNPLAPADRFAERVPLMNSKTLVWPRFS